MALSDNFISGTLNQTFGYAFGRFSTVFKAAAIPTLLFTFFVFYYFFPSFFGVIFDLAMISESEDPTVVFALLGQIAIPTLLMMILGLIYYGVIFGPLLLNVIYDEPVGLLRMDGTVLRIIGALLVIYLIIFAATFVIAIPIGILQAMMMAGGGDGGALAGQLLLNLIIYAAMFYILVRTSLILPDVAASGRLRISEGWRATKGHFWKLFAVYFIAYLVIMIVTYIAMGIALASAFIGANQSGILDSIGDADFDPQLLLEALASLGTSPMGIAAILIYSLAMVFSMGAYAALLGFSYRNIVGSPEQIPN